MVFTTTTDENGDYDVLEPARRHLHGRTRPFVTAGRHRTARRPDGGAPDGVSVVELSDGTIDDDQDFGVGGLGTIGARSGSTWTATGVRDLGEPGLEGATVTATYLGPDGEPGGGGRSGLITTVDASGNYLFEGCRREPTTSK